MLKELLSVEKKTTTRKEKIANGKKLTSKGKHAVKVGNHPHTNMIWKPAVVRKESSLK